MADKLYLDGHELAVTAIKGGFEIKSKETKTVGGRVIQVFGTNYQDVVVSGTLGSGGWEAQVQFLESILQYAEDVVKRPKRAPSILSFPAAGWTFQVYLVGYREGDGGAGVTHDNMVIQPTWELTFMVVNDGGFKKIATDAYIERLQEGLGWAINTYNGDSVLFGPGVHPASDATPDKTYTNGGVTRK